MGLTIRVGEDAVEDDDDAEYVEERARLLDEILVANGLRPHVEPTDLDPVEFEMYGYSGIHDLRRVAAHLDLEGRLPEPRPTGIEGMRSAIDPILLEYEELAADPDAVRPRSLLARLFGRGPARPALTFDHLIQHSDAEGCYVPQEFAEVLVADELNALAGYVGSSQRLFAETTRLAEALGAPLDLDPESDELWSVTDGDGREGWKRYGVESFTCLRLRAAARLSVERGALLVFG